MAERMVTANIALDIFCFLLSLIPTFYMFGQKRYKERLNLYFGGMAISNNFMILGDLADWCLQTVRSPFEYYLLEWLSVVYFAASGIVLLFLTLYITEYLQLSKKSRKRWIYPAAVLCILQVFFAVITPFTGAVFFVTENGYQRGKLFLISQIIPYLNYLICFLEIIYYRKRLKRREKVFFLLYIMIPLLCCIIQMFTRGISIINSGVIITFMLIFVNIQIESELSLQKQKIEMKDQMISIMLSQIRPHFLYNSLGTIAQLCRTDPQNAEHTIEKFSNFLRANMDSLKCNAPIPFPRELEHVKNYVYMEQQRFGERLQVIYQIKADHFMVPPLSLQPLVENAVVHGVLHRKEGGHITITTSETDQQFVILIADDGIGMKKSNQQQDLDGHAHIGIENVRERLKSMVNGELSITSDDKGTTVVIKIPREGIGQK